MKIPPSLRPVGAGPVPALTGKTDATISMVTSQGRPRVAPLQSFFHPKWRAAGSWKLCGESCFAAFTTKDSKTGRNTTGQVATKRLRRGASIPSARFCGPGRADAVEVRVGADEDAAA